MKVHKSALLASFFALACAVAAPVLTSQDSRDAASRPGSPSVTVFPVLLAGVPSADAANAVAMLIERGGHGAVETAATVFRPDPAAAWDAQAQAFAAAVAKSPVATDTALFAAFLGTPGKSVDEVRGVLADRAGRIVWQERLRAGDPIFDAARPTCPMDCAVLLVKRLRAPLRIGDPLRSEARPGRIASTIEAQAGMPDAAERAAMEARHATWRTAWRRVPLEVHPLRNGARFSKDDAGVLAKALVDAGALGSAPAAAPLTFETIAAVNEQRVLWSGARSIREAVAKAPPSAAYRLFVDWFVSDKGGFVHLYLVAPDGSFAIVDYRNDHHDDFARAAPKDATAVCDFVARRLLELSK